MFGIAVARLDALSDQQKARYQALYCGLCRALRDSYGNVGRATLSYDLTFLAMLLDSLFEPPQKHGSMRCISHPRKGVEYSSTRFADYCADLSVALSYSKCLDDIEDEGTLRSRAARLALSRAYERAKGKIPEQCQVIEHATLATFEIEALGADAPSDAAAIAFGDMLGFLFESFPADTPSMAYEQLRRSLRRFGEDLGRFVYMMDAAVDFRDDAKRGSYNPFVNMRVADMGIEASGDPDARNAVGRLGADDDGPSIRPSDLVPDVAFMRDVLASMAAKAIEGFDRLPLEQDLEIMQCILYAGVWQKFNLEYRDDARAHASRTRIARTPLV